MSRHAPVGRAIDDMFEKGRWTGFTRFLDDGRICLTNNCAERALRGVAPRQEEPALRQLRLRRREDRRHLRPHPHREAQRRRLAGLARRRPDPHRWHASIASRQDPAVELERRRSREHRLTAVLGRRFIESAGLRLHFQASTCASVRQIKARGLHQRRSSTPTEPRPTSWAGLAEGVATGQRPSASQPPAAPCQRRSARADRASGLSGPESR